MCTSTKIYMLLLAFFFLTKNALCRFSAFILIKISPFLVWTQARELQCLSCDEVGSLSALWALFKRQLELEAVSLDPYTSDMDHTAPFDPLLGQILMRRTLSLQSARDTSCRDFHFSLSLAPKSRETCALMFCFHRVWIFHNTLWQSAIVAGVRTNRA